MVVWIEAVRKRRGAVRQCKDIYEAMANDVSRNAHVIG